MSDQHPQSRRLRELLARIKGDQIPESFEDYGLDPDNPGTYNSHTLFQEASAKITAEQDINIVREIALNYLDVMCSATPDFAATAIYLKMRGITT